MLLEQEGEASRQIPMLGSLGSFLVFTMTFKLCCKENPLYLCVCVCVCVHMCVHVPVYVCGHPCTYVMFSHTVKFRDTSMMPEACGCAAHWL